LAGHGAWMGKKISAYRILMGRTKQKIALGRAKRRRQVNIKIYLRETGALV
jgi:hypothetical protein